MARSPIHRNSLPRFSPLRASRRLHAVMLVWAMFTLLCAPVAATLHAFTHLHSVTTASSVDTPSLPQPSEHCDRCAQWEAFGDGLIGKIAFVHPDLHIVFDFRSPAVAVDTAATRWYMQRAPPLA
ncbi:hypothetical protein RBI14_03930 [Alcaligenaceae bacterium B3P038]|nr:hypothetical protein [Alcaligenaceae bacterium B3P038]